MKLRPAIATILLALTAVVAFAENARAYTMEIPLYKLTPYMTLTMRCVHAEFAMSIPVAERMAVRKSALKLFYSASPSLIPESSKLVVRINDYPAAQITLNPAVLENEFDVPISVSNMKPGYNNLAFEVFQHYNSRNDCEFPCEPDLWTTLNMEKSTLTIEYDLKPIPLQLSMLSRYMFDPKTFPHGDIHVVMNNRTPELLNASTIVTSGIARRFDYKDVRFTLSSDIEQDVDNLVIGLEEDLRPFLANLGVTMGEVTGGYIKILHLPTKADGEKKVDTTRGMLVVSGKNYDDVIIAAETLAHISFAFPGSDEMTAVSFSIPSITMYSGRMVLTADKIYDFKTLNFPTHTFKGFNATPRDIQFRLPADFLIKQNQKAILKLNFAYGPGFGTTSTFNILLNGNVATSIHLDNKNGAFVQRYEVELPTYLFRVGSNSLAFAPVMAPDAKMCEFIQEGNLFLTLFDTSTMYFPAMPHFVELPKLELFVLNGFPLTRWPDGYESEIFLMDTEDETIAAMFNVVGVVTQKNGFPLFGIKVVTEQPKNYNGEMLVFGLVKNINPEFIANAPLKFNGDETTVPYPVIRSWEDEATLAYSKQKSDMGVDVGLLMQYQSPDVESRSITLFTADKPKGLYDLSVAYMDPLVQAQIEGDMALVELYTEKYKVASFEVGKPFTTGKSGKVSVIEYYLVTYPSLYYAAIVLVTIIVTIVSYMLLQRFRRKRLQKTAKE